MLLPGTSAVNKIGAKPHFVTAAERRCWPGKEVGVLDTYTAVLAVASAGLLLVFSGFAKSQLAWRRERSTFVRRRRRRH
jgi:hypothetical protein